MLLTGLPAGKRDLTAGQVSSSPAAGGAAVPGGRGGPGTEDYPYPAHPWGTDGPALRGLPASQVSSAGVR
ncbi:hypothetical protein NKG05_27275 [Oerskovia sp. M15]